MKKELVLEAALFSAGRPLDKDEIANATGLSKTDIKGAIKKLMRRYKRMETSLEVGRIGRKYVMQLKTEFGENARKLAKAEVPAKLLKTLALIAFHQPLRQSKLKEMIGDKIYVHVHELRDLKLVRAVRDGRSKLLSTTKYFPEYFGIDATRKDSIKRYLAKKVGIDVIMADIGDKEVDGNGSGQQTLDEVVDGGVDGAVDAPDTTSPAADAEVPVEEVAEGHVEGPAGEEEKVDESDGS